MALCRMLDCVRPLLSLGRVTKLPAGRLAQVAACRVLAMLPLRGPRLKPETCSSSVPAGV
jgi:hypothetical protein